MKFASSVAVRSCDLLQYSEKCLGSIAAARLQPFGTLATGTTYLQQPPSSHSTSLNCASSPLPSQTFHTGTIACSETLVEVPEESFVHVHPPSTFSGVESTDRQGTSPSTSSGCRVRLPPSSSGPSGLSVVGNAYQAAPGTRETMDKGRDVDPPQDKNTTSPVNVYDHKVGGPSETF